MDVVTLYWDPVGVMIYVSSTASPSISTTMERDSFSYSIKHTTLINSSSELRTTFTATSTTSTEAPRIVIATETNTSYSSSLGGSPSIAAPSTLAIVLISAAVFLSFVFVLAGWLCWKCAAPRRGNSATLSSTESRNRYLKVSSMLSSIRSWDSKQPFEPEVSSSSIARSKHGWFDDNLDSSIEGCLGGRGQVVGDHAQGSEDERQERSSRWASRFRNGSLASQGSERTSIMSREGRARLLRIPRPTLRLPLPSILKRPHTPTPSLQISQRSESIPSSRPILAARNTYYRESRREYRPPFAQNIPKTAREMTRVRFDMTQVRVFGRTPTDSAAGSTQTG